MPLSRVTLNHQHNRPAFGARLVNFVHPNGPAVTAEQTTDLLGVLESISGPVKLDSEYVRFSDDQPCQYLVLTEADRWALNAKLPQMTNCLAQLGKKTESTLRQMYTRLVPSAVRQFAPNPALAELKQKLARQIIENARLTQIRQLAYSVRERGVLNITVGPQAFTTLAKPFGETPGQDALEQVISGLNDALGPLMMLRHMTVGATPLVDDEGALSEPLRSDF
ncbi:MAG: hypothetical protein KC476_01790 [Cyanobacteria bacterium HKST-UBA06]|nr:hypothetical protein [Cyanobacteria bacterium HKST-UBA06]